MLLAFFILAIQLFITLIEFKLTTLAGFVLIPFGLFGKTAFAAERVLGNVISSGVKVLVLAVIVGIGSTLFSQFTAGFGGNSADDRRCHGAGARGAIAVGPRHFRSRHRQRHRLRRTATRRGRCSRNGLAAGGVVAAGAGLAAGGAGLAGGAIAGAARGGAAILSGATAGLSSGGLGGVAEAGGSAAMSPLRRTAAAWPATGKRVNRLRALRRTATGLGAAHETRADHSAWRVGSHPCGSLR